MNDEARDIKNHPELFASSIRIEHDIETSAHIQRRLLAGNYELYIEGIELSAETLPSNRVDGDFFDFISLSPGSLDFLIGDVMGKGIPAALTAVAAKTMVYRSLILKLAHDKAIPSIGSIMTEVEKKLGKELMEMGKFLTLYYCRIDLDRGFLRFIDAGHTSFCLYKAFEEKCWLVKGSNMPLGFVAEQTLREYSIPIDTGDLIFFYSDGISEAENGEGELFGEERLRKVILAQRGATAAEIVKKVLNLAFFYTSRNFRDDATAIALSITGRDPECGSGSSRSHITYKSQAQGKQIKRGNSKFAKTLRQQFLTDIKSLPFGADGDAALLLCHGLMEGLSNILAHTHGKASIDWKISDASVCVSYDFKASDYDWFAAPCPEIGAYPEGGYGSWIITQAFDSYAFLRGKGEECRIILVKEFPHKEGPT